MSDNLKNNTPEGQPEILVNDYGQTKDNAVVVEEADRTVLLTPDETIVIQKDPEIDIVPRNRPRHIYQGMWGPTEIATVGVGLLAILATLLVYVFLVLPSDRDLARNKSERDRLEAELASANTKYGSITNTQDQVTKMVKSVDDFQTLYLPAAANGRYALYERLNSLISANGLVNTSGPDYAPLDTNEEVQRNNGDQTEDTAKGKAKFRSLFPGVYVTMTVEGSYANLRRFIQQIETGQEFVVISAIKLQPSETRQQVTPENPAPNAAPAQAAMTGRPTMGQMQGVNPPSPMQAPVVQQGPAPRAGKTHGEVVSLRLEMAAYFRRSDFGSSTAQ